MNSPSMRANVEFLAGVVLSCLLLAGNTAAQRARQAPAQPSTDVAGWSFAVSGDSRNCGDVVMPAIAAHVKDDGALFYWHLGDFRWNSNFDEDYHQLHPQATIAQYEMEAWPDFIEHQLRPFGSTPVFLARGNHEIIPPKTDAEYLTQFADWLLTPKLQEQRLADSATDHRLRAYYHWIEHNVAFIALDNASTDQFDRAQMEWLKGVLDMTAHNASIQSLVIGMHEAFPDSLSAGHSMNDSAQEEASGRAAYAALLGFQRSTGKHVYVLASHSHFYLDNVYATACRAKEDVLPGWIVGTAGASRYRLPADRGGSTLGVEGTYGYLLGRVAADGAIRFEWRPLTEQDVPAATVSQFTPAFVDTCFVHNKSDYQPAGAACAAGAAGSKAAATPRK